MKTCKRCFRKFDQSKYDISPSTEVADIFLKDMGVEDINDICPECREELGVKNLLVFEEEE
jgi:hypothetical protein